MRPSIIVRVSKIFRTCFRNMRRRRKNPSFVSPLPLILLFAGAALLRAVSLPQVVSIRRARIWKNERLTMSENGFNATLHHTSENDPHREATHVAADAASSGKREDFRNRRLAERRAMHRRIVERQREEQENRHEAVPQTRHDIATEQKHSDSGNVHGKEAAKHRSEDSAGHAADAGHRHEHGPSQVVEEHTTSHDAKEGKPSEAKASGEHSNRHSVMTVPSKPSREHTRERKSTKSESHGKDVSPKSDAAVPAGARVHGKLAEFGGSLGGTENGMLRGQNVTRVSYTLFKIMKLFGFVSLVDSPAGSHAEWMPELVERMSYDHPSFRYTAVDTTEGIERAKKAVGDLVDGEYIVSDVEHNAGNGSDILFHWTELDGGARDARGQEYMEHIRRVLISAKNGDNGYIILGQFPRLNGPTPTYRKGKWVFGGDEKEDPFLYNEHVRGVVPMGSGRESYMLYMTFYSLRSMPMSELQV